VSDAIAGELPLAEPVSLSRRFGALLVDWILCLLVTFGFGVRLQTSGVIPVAILVVEYAFFIGLFAQTPGMWIASLRCVSVRTGGRIGIFRAALRGVLLALVIPALVMGPDRRGWHDKAAGSVMVFAPRR
jgi:uncharacterized RDD family membrane protein YckC